MRVTGRTEKIFLSSCTRSNKRPLFPVFTYEMAHPFFLLRLANIVVSFPFPTHLSRKRSAIIIHSSNGVPIRPETTEIRARLMFGGTGANQRSPNGRSALFGSLRKYTSTRPNRLRVGRESATTKSDES